MNDNEKKKDCDCLQCRVGEVLGVWVGERILKLGRTPTEEELLALHVFVASQATLAGMAAAELHSVTSEKVAIINGALQAALHHRMKHIEGMQIIPLDDDGVPATIQ